jgi:hypothetical protein
MENAYRVIRVLTSIRGISGHGDCDKESTRISHQLLSNLASFCYIAIRYQ